jgi:hypothetical protein
MWRKIKFYFVSLLIIVLAGLALYYRYIPQLNDLVTVKYNIQKAIGLEEQKVPFGTEKVLLMVQAKVLGGVDLKGVAMTNTDDRLQIQLPPAKILDVSIDDKETRVWDHSISWWAVWVSPNPDLEQGARRAALEAVQQAALQMGLLSNAQRNAEITIREFLRSAGISNVTITAGTAAP